MKLPAASLYAGVFFALMICACNLSEHPADTLLNVKLDDSLSSYDSIQLDILYPDGKVFKDAIFIGKYTPGPDHELKNLNLGENPPTEFRIRITGIRKGKRALEIVVPVTSAGPQASEVVYRERPIDTVRPPITTEPKNVEITTPSPLVLFTGTADFSVSARVKPMEAPQGLLWMTSNNGVARVDSTGKIIPVTVGEADITARSRRDTTLFATLHLVVKDSVLIKGIKVSAESLLLYTGGASIKLIGQIDPADVNLSVVYSSRNDSVAKAGADGTISPVKSGKTEVLVFPAGMPALAVAVVVTVKTDMPVLEAGSDRFVNALDTLNFPLKVTQEYGSVAALKWDLDGNGIWDDSTTLAEANPRRMYDGKDSLIAIHFYVRDGEGNVSVADKKVHVNPRPILAAPTFTSATTTSPTRSPRPTWAWTGAKGGSGTFRYSLDNKPEVETRALSYTADSLADGEHILVLRELDSLGVASLSSSKTLKIITKAQSVTITSPTSGLLTNANSIPVEWDLQALDGTTTKNKSDESLVGKQGLIWIVRSHTDALGNRGADSVRIFRDTIPPGTPTFTSQTSPAIVNAAYTSPVQWAWTRISPKDSFLVSLNGAVATRQAGQTYTLSNPTNQSYMLSVVALDTAGNKSASADFTILVDRAAPPAPSVTGTTLTATPAWSWGPGTGSDGAKVYHYKLSTATTYSAETSATSYSPTGLGTGKYTLLVQERDAAGNWSVDGSLAIEVDKTGPSVAIGKPTPMGRVTSVDPVVSGVVTDDHGIKKVEYRINSATYVPASLTGGNWTFTEAYDVGVNTIWVRGEDQFGSRDSVSIKIYKYPNVVFVRKNATGKGKSWEDALGELYSALDPTNNYSLGTQIWVAAGSYGGSPGNPQEIAIYHSEMTIKGGFRSDVPATDSTMRDLANFPSILTKILFLGANSTEIHDLNFDGFTLKDRLWLANADHYRVRFGNLTLDKITSTQNILLTRGNNILFDKCIFANLVSTDDAALFLKGSVEFRGCRFENNRGNSGYSPVALGGASITIRTSYFANSMAPDGNRHFYLDYSGQNLDIQSSKIQGGKSSILLDPGFPPEQFIYSGNEDF